MPHRLALNLLPMPRSVKLLAGVFHLPRGEFPFIRRGHSIFTPPHPEGYALTIDREGISLDFHTPAGFRAAAATLCQLVRQFGRRLPCLQIRDWPDFARRGVMLDISRGRVPKLASLLDLAEKLADLKINELQLYTEHTFAYRRYKAVWQDWGALTGAEIRQLDAHCRQLGIDLVPNQNSFGHLREFLADRRLAHLGELAEPYEADTHDFLRRPTTLAPRHPGTLPFLRGLYDELLPNFSSRFFNVGCDETWDLGKGRSRARCEARGKGAVYFDFLKQIHREVSARGKTMMFWGDIILKYPRLIPQLPKDAIALTWGYEANHPFDKEAAHFSRANIPFYVCPGTSTWQTLIGRHDNALANLRAAAAAGKKYGAMGFLNTDWGDGGHPQPLAVSWPMFAAGAALAWNASALDEKVLTAVLDRDIYEDRAGRMAAAAMGLGRAHRKLGVTAVNETPLGTVIAAPKPEDRELFCRNGLKWFGKIPMRKIAAALDEIDRRRHDLFRAKPASVPGLFFALDLDLAARMAALSGFYMLWQKLAAAGDRDEGRKMARWLIRELARLEKDFNEQWPLGNKATPRHCAPFLRWRSGELQRSLGKAPRP